MSKPALDVLAEQISSCNPTDPEVQTMLVSTLNTLRDESEVPPGSEPFRCLDAASLLTELLSRLRDDRAATQVKNVVAALVRVANGSGSEADTANPPTPPMPSKGTTPIETAALRGGEPLEMDAEPEDDGAFELTEDGVRKIKAKGKSTQRLRLINEMMLGEILVQLGMLKGDDLVRAVEQQSVTGKPLGITLVDLGAASAEDIETGLRFQHQLQAPRASKVNLKKRASGVEASVVSDLLLGETLVRLGMITSEELKEGLLAHHAAGVRIGEALAQAGVVSWEQIARAVEIQKQYRRI